MQIPEMIKSKNNFISFKSDMFYLLIICFPINELLNYICDHISICCPVFILPNFKFAFDDLNCMPLLVKDDNTNNKTYTNRSHFNAY